MNSYTLQNDHNVYVLGAGFSADANLPVMRNFLTNMRDSIGWLTDQGRGAEREAIESVLEFRLRAASAAYRTAIDLENVEELFSLASAAGLLDLTTQMQRAIAATLDFCSKTSPTISARRRALVLAKTCPIRQSPDLATWRLVSATDIGFVDGWEYLDVPDYQLLLGALVGKLSPSSQERRNTIITFNYDLLVEEFLIRSDSKIDYCIPTESLESTAPWIQEGGTPVLKLHGSMNWMYSDDARTRIVAHNSYDDMVASQRTPLLVPPTWRKDFPSQLAHVWDAALCALRTATRIIVTGFSMPPTDQHFRYLLAAGLRDNISLRQILFADPDTANVSNQARRIFRPELAERGVIQFLERSTLALLQRDVLSFIGRPLADGMRITPE